MRNWKSIVNITETKSRSFEEVNTIHKPLDGLTKSKGRTEGGESEWVKEREVLTTTEIPLGYGRIIKQYYEQAYTPKFPNLGEWTKSLKHTIC